MAEQISFFDGVGAFGVILDGEVSDPGGAITEEPRQALPPGCCGLCSSWVRSPDSRLGFGRCAREKSPYAARFTLETSTCEGK